MAGSLPHMPARVFAQFLIDMGLCQERTTDREQPNDWPVSWDNEPSYPNNLVHVNDTSPILFVGDSHGNRGGQEGLQVVVKSGTPETGWTKVNEIKVALDGYRADGRRVVNVDGTQYCIGLVRRASGPLRLGPEGNTTRRKYTLNILTVISLYDG